MQTHTSLDPTPRQRRFDSASLALAAAAALLTLGATTPAPLSGEEQGGHSLRDTREVLGKWIETQQILSKEQTEWQQGREVLGSRIEVMRREVLGLQEKVAETKKRIAETQAKRAALVARKSELEAQQKELATKAATMESAVRELHVSLPDPVRERIQPLFARLPEPSAETRVTAAERFQNVLGILNEVNKANGEIHVTYEVRNLADGKPNEVRVMYVGLAQAWYLSANGQAGVGRPSIEGWQWQPSPAVSAEVFQAFEIIQGKHTPAFVPLPVRIQ
jgi:Protein of unknown function (DUF3450)